MSLSFGMTQLLGRKIPQRSVANMKYPDGLPSLINFVKNPVDVSPLTREEAANLPLCDFCFACKWAAIGQFFERV